MRLVATCLAATGAGLAEALRRAHPRVGERGLVEARLDRLDRPVSRAELAVLLKAAGGRLLATCRPGASGAPPTEAERLDLLKAAGDGGAAGVDAEFGSEAVTLDLPAGCERIVSHHEPEDADPQGPEDARRLVAALRGTGASRLKLAAPARDAVQGLAWMRAARAEAGGAELSPIPLGPGGRGLRLLAGRGLSSLLYCSEGAPAAAGQPRLDDVLDVHAAESCGPETPLLAVVGRPLDATWSPVLHGTLLRRSGREGLLVPLPVERVDAILPLLEELGVRGAAVTMPHKESLVARVSRRSERVRRCGSLNSLRRGPEGWEAESFDGPAALEAMGGASALADRHVAVLGAGGAAAALVAELAAAGVLTTVLARRAEAARDLAQRLGVRHAALESLAAIAVDVVVNATPAEPRGALGRELAFDMRTTPPMTPWLRRAADAGLRTVDGLAMFARQAAAQQRYWGLACDDAEAEARLRELVAAREGQAA